MNDNDFPIQIGLSKQSNIISIFINKIVYL